MKRKIGIGVQIGGKGIAAGAVDLEKNVLIDNSFFEAKVDKNGSARHITTLWSMLINKVIGVLNADEIVGAGVSIPGPFQYLNGIANYRGLEKYGSLDGVNVTTELKKRLKIDRDIEIRYVNDAIGFSIGEDWVGQLKGCKRAISIIIDEGFGSAFLINGVPVISGNGVPSMGTVYNLPYGGGLADDYFSIRGLLGLYGQSGSILVQNIRFLQSLGRNTDQVKSVFTDFGQNLGDFLGPIFKAFDSDIAVFGGEVGSQMDLFEDALNESLGRQNCSTKIVMSDSSNHSFILGGARLLNESYWKKISSIIAVME